MPTDADTNNVYEYRLSAKDDDNNIGNVEVSITITNVLESSTLTVSGLEDGSVDENS